MSITPLFTNDQSINCASLDKAQAAQAGPLFTQIEAASNKSNHLVAIKGLHKAPLWTKLGQSW